MTSERALSVFHEAAGKCEAAELCVRRVETTSAHWRRGQLMGTVVRADFESQLRVITGDRIGTAIRHGADDCPGHWAEIVDEAIEAAALGPPATGDLFAGAVATDDAVGGPAAVTAEELGAPVYAEARPAEAAGLDLTATVETVWGTILTSRGARIEHGFTRYRCEGRSRAGAHGWYARWQGGTPDHGGGPGVAIRRLLPQPATARPADTTGVEVVVFQPAAAARLMEMLVPMFDGSRAASGLSPVVRWVGLKAVDERISIAVDRTEPGGPWTTVVDDQGVPTRTCRLVDSGVIAGFYGTLTEARAMDSVTPGFGVRPVNGLIRPHPGHILVTGGDLDEAALVGQADCLVVSELEGKIHETGDFFVTVAQGEVFRSGESVGTAPPVALVGNTYQMLNRLVGLSSTVTWVEGELCLPAIGVAGVRILTA